MDVVISVDAVDSPTGEEPEGEVRFTCKVWHAQGQYVPFNAFADFSASPSTMNAAIKAAAVSAAALESVTIGLLDKKTLVGAGIGLL